jgi:hypothetical protein
MRLTMHKLPKFGKFESAEQIIDMLVMVLMVGLGAVMMIGLLTATGHVTW